MSSIIFENVSFQYPDTENPVFSDFNINLPEGIVTLIGQNGTGKTTFLLLAGGCLLPDHGKVFIFNIDTQSLRDEQKRQEYISFVFQNMEFETDDSIGDLLNYVYEHGFHKEKNPAFIPLLIKTFELEKILNSKTQNISKGELQRTILAFSLLYGSKIIILDEPVFAMETYQKHKAMEFISDYSRKHHLTILYSVHELEISEKYSDYALLFYKNREPEIGPAKEIITREKLEQAYQIPYVLLKTKESDYRDRWKK